MSKVNQSVTKEIDALKNKDILTIVSYLDQDIVDGYKTLLNSNSYDLLSDGLTRYVKEALNNNYYSYGINEKVIKKLMPFDNYHGLKGIDFGFGNAEVLTTLAALGTDIIGIDINPIFVQNARNNGLSAYLIAADTPREQFQKDISFFGLCDFVISTLVIDRIAKPHNYIQNMLCVLKPGGRFALQTLLPISGIDDGETDVPIIYTPPENRITSSESIAHDKTRLLGILVENGLTDINIYELPYIVSSRDGIQRYRAWSFSGVKSDPPDSNYLRMYRTGDLARYHLDGSIEFIGRVDEQIKINGVRLEPSEVESALTDYPPIQHAIVLVKSISDTQSKQNNQYLIAYYISDDVLNNEDISRHLSTILPRSVIPSIYIRLESFPYNISGKIDKSSLPVPELNGVGDDYEAAESECESILCRLFAEILNDSPSEISIKADFFLIGGDSILAIKLTNRINQQFKIDSFDISAIYKCRTIQALADHINMLDHQHHTAEVLEEGAL